MNDEDRKKAHRDRIEYLHSENQKLADKLGRLGMGISPSDIKDVRFELLIQVLLGDTDQEKRLDFEERFQAALNAGLTNTVKDAETKSRMARLHVPGRGDNGRPS